MEYIWTVLLALFWYPSHLGLVTLGECPQGWDDTPIGCLVVMTAPANRMFGTVEIGTPSFPTVFAARATCWSVGGEIASLPTFRHQLAAFDLIRVRPLADRPKRVYMGLHDLYTEGLYQWINGEDAVYKNWGESEPNNNFQGNEDCALLESQDLKWIANNNTVWKDYPCCADSGIRHVFCWRSNQEGSLMTTITKFPFLDTCTAEVQCEAVPIWKVRVNDTARSVGTIVNYTCPEGSVFKENPDMTSLIAVCSENGTWSPTFDTCEMAEEDRGALIAYIYGNSTEAQGAVAIGTVGIVFMAVELALVILVDLDNLARSLLFLKRNVCSFICVTCCRRKRKKPHQETEMNNIEVTEMDDSLGETGSVRVEV